MPRYRPTLSMLFNYRNAEKLSMCFSFITKLKRETIDPCSWVSFRYLYKIIGYNRIDSSLRLYIQMQNMRKYYSEYISFFFLFKVFLCVISEINNMHFWFSFLIQSLSSLKQYTCNTSKDLSSSINFIYLYVYIRNLLSSTSV